VHRPRGIFKGIKMALRIGLLLLTAWGAAAPAPAAASPAEDAQQIYQRSAASLYNLDFNAARQGFEGLTREYPDNPEYWNAVASSVWLKILYDQQKLNIESYSGSTFGTKSSKDAIDPAEEKKLREIVGIAMKKAQGAIDKNPKDVRALYALGIAHATIASFEGTAKRAYFAAYGQAKTARNLHQQVLKLDPNFDDARLAVGIYNYVVGVIPGYIRILLAPFGVRGEGKEVGIRQIETAAAKGKQVSTDAKMILVVIYNREKKHDQALQLIEELHAKYPRNFLFELAKASIFGKMKKWDQALQTYQQVARKTESSIDGYDRLRAEPVHYEIGRTQIELHKEDDAVLSFSKVVAGARATPDEKAQAHLWMGRVFDAKKDRKRALQHYNAVTGLDCDAEWKKEAEAYKRKPYGA